MIGFFFSNLANSVGSSMIHEEAEDRANQLDTPTDNKKAIDHNKVKTVSHKGAQEKQEKAPSLPKHQAEDNKKKLTNESKNKNNDAAAKLDTGDNGENKVHLNPLDVGSESTSLSTEESNVDDDAGKGDLLEENLMKMDKRYFNILN